MYCPKLIAYTVMCGSMLNIGYHTTVLSRSTVLNFAAYKTTRHLKTLVDGQHVVNIRDNRRLLIITDRDVTGRCAADHCKAPTQSNVFHRVDIRRMTRQTAFNTNHKTTLQANQHQLINWCQTDDKTDSLQHQPHNNSTSQPTSGATLSKLLRKISYLSILGKSLAISGKTLIRQIFNPLTN